MADGVNTGGFVPTQPAIVDTSAAFTRLLNVAQRQQERETALQLAEAERRRKQMEAQLDIINGFDASKMVADDRMMFNDAVNQLRMDFVEGKITDPMDFRGRVGKLRNYYNQFTQYAQNPETLAARDNLMKISYYPSELKKANDALGAGVEYVASQGEYNNRVNTFEHPLAGASYQITPQGDILVDSAQGNIPVDAMPRQGAQLFIPGLNYTGEGLTIDSMADEAYVLREINAASNLNKYADRSFEGQAMLGSQGGRAAQIGSWTDDRGGFSSYPEIEELHITSGRSAVRDLIEQTRSTDADRATAMQETYDEFLTYAQDEWKKSVLARRPKTTTSAAQTQANRERQQFLNNYGFSSMGERIYAAVRGVDMKNVMVRQPELVDGEPYYEPMNILSIGVDRNGLVVAEAVPKDGGASTIVNLSSYPENYQAINEKLLDDKNVSLDELITMHKGNVPTPQGITPSEEPAQQYPVQLIFPEDTIPVSPPPVEESLPEGVRVQSTVPRKVLTAREEAREAAIQNPEQVRETVINNFRGKMMNYDFGSNMRSLLQEEKFLLALIDAGYVDPRGLIGDLNMTQRKQAMMKALDAMEGDERAEYLKRMVML